MGRDMTDFDARIGARLRHFRISQGLTQQQLAALIGVTYQQAHKYENGINRISAGRLWRCMCALSVSPEEFFSGLGAQPINPPAHERATLEFLKVAANLSLPHRAAVLSMMRVLVSEQESE